MQLRTSVDKYCKFWCMTTNQDIHSAITDDLPSENNANTLADPRWVTIRPSNTNLILTSLLAMLAIGALWLVPLSLWLRIVLCCIALLILVVEVIQIRMLSRFAIGAFYLQLRDSPIVSDDSAAANSKRPSLGIRVRYANPQLRGLKAADEADGAVCGSPYVSTYFSTITYILDSDPAWRRYMPRLLALWADGVEREQFRQVRVLLKWRL